MQRIFCLGWEYDSGQIIRHDNGLLALRRILHRGGQWVFLFFLVWRTECACERMCHKWEIVEALYTKVGFVFLQT